MADEARRAVLDLLEQRDADQTLCPSEAARHIAGTNGDWRAQMENVHAAVDELLAAGTIAISWKGVEREQRSGPYRIARRPLPPV
jgi:hypothetical protein